MLAVDRGIPCEGHTQILSHHCTNTPSEEAVKLAVQKHQQVIESRINAFVAFVHAHDGDWGFNNAVAIQFKLHLLKAITQWAETEQTRLDAEDQKAIPKEEQLTTSFLWEPREGHENGLDVVVHDRVLAEAISQYGRPWGVRVEQDGALLARYDEEELELEMMNAGTQTTAKKLLEVARTGRHGHFGSHEMTEVSRTICQLQVDLAAAQKEIEGLRSTTVKSTA